MMYLLGEAAVLDWIDRHTPHKFTSCIVCSGAGAVVVDKWPSNTTEFDDETGALHAVQVVQIKSCHECRGGG